MPIGKKANYSIPSFLVVLGILVRLDIVESATRIREVWPIIGPVLPPIALSLVVVGGFWLMVLLALHSLECQRRTKKANRKQVIDDMRLLAKHSGIGRSHPKGKIGPSIELLSRIELAKKRLKTLKLVQSDDASPKSLSIRLHQLIPIVEEEGIKAAQSHFKKKLQARK